MQNVLEHTGHTEAMPRRPGRVQAAFRTYRNDVGLFWRVMLPIIIVSLVLSSAGFLLFKFVVTDAQWTFSASGGIGMRGDKFSFDPASRISQPVPKPMDGQVSRGFSTSSLSINFPWFAMCPLVLMIVYRQRCISITSGEVWRHILRRTLSILGAFLLFYLIWISPGLIPALLLLTGVKFWTLNGPVGFFIFLVTAGVGVASIYFLIKFGLCLHCLIVENLSVVAALRRSSQLVHGAWGRLFGIYLLLGASTIVVTTAILGFTLFLFSVAVPEFAPLREVLQSGTFFGIFSAIISLQQAPVWTIVAMVTVNILIAAVLAPFWALLTTHFYTERAGTPEQHISG